MDSGSYISNSWIERWAKVRWLVVIQIQQNFSIIQLTAAYKPCAFQQEIFIIKYTTTQWLNIHEKSWQIHIMKCTTTWTNQLTDTFTIQFTVYNNYTQLSLSCQLTYLLAWCTLCSEKKHPLTFSFISPWIICGFKFCEYTQGLIDSDNVKNRYSLRSMTYLWRHICLAKVGASLQHAISRDAKDIIFCEYRVLAGA